MAPRNQYTTPSEEVFLHKIIALCKELKLLVFHSGDARRDVGAGFPDLCIVSTDGCGIIFAELKMPGGKMGEKQTTWKWALKANGVSWRLWRPSDWSEIEAELRSIA